MAISDFTTKYCRKCSSEHPVSNFGKCSRSKDGCQIWCKACMLEYREKNREKTRAQDKIKYHKNRDGYLNSWYKRKYGISLEDYNNIFNKQNGKCAICRGKCSSGRRLAVDHDHKTGIVRGLLCGHCNQAIGKLHDSPEIIKRALDYVLQRSHLI
jgi:hypothetical protein